MRLSGLITLVLVCCVNDAASQSLETLNASYASVTGSRIPLWIAKDAGLFEKYGLHVNLVVIAAGNAAIGALAGETWRCSARRERRQ
jgi:ABC-type nitrate/sulfonate/bicarbonate transport system substrate-binding protein